MEITSSDILHFQRAVALAFDAEKYNNLPIGAVITLEDKVIAEGQNAIWYPAFNQNRHAEIEALRNVPEELWKDASDMTLYTTLEPCLMCLGGILLHRVGRVLYGSADPYGGADNVRGYMPPFFEEQMSRTIWIGPAYPEVCNRLYERTMELINRVSAP